MKLIIAGSRNYNDEADFFQRMNNIVAKNDWVREVTEVVSGTARGADSLGEKWATFYGFDITRFPANWNKFGRGAGHMRNAEMADYADGLILFWDGVSKGSGNMLDNARSRNLKIHVELV